jgi:hypothetical protein
MVWLYRLLPRRPDRRPTTKRRLGKMTDTNTVSPFFYSIFIYILYFLSFVIKRKIKNKDIIRGTREQIKHYSDSDT